MTDTSAANAPQPTDDLEALVQSGLPLVQYAVSDLAGRLPRHVLRDDLVSAGMLGLVQAAKTWDPTRGVTFDRFARRRIQGALLDELRQRDWASRSVRANARRLQAAAVDITARTGEAPDAAQLSAEMGLTPSELDKLNGDVHRATVLHWDAIFTDVDDCPVTSTGGDQTLDTLLQREMVGYLRDAVVSLPERLRKVVVEYFFEERPMQEIADDLGVTESRISQMRAEAIELLRSGMVAAIEPPEATDEAPPARRATRRQAAYAAEVASASTFQMRVSANAPGVHERLSALG